jgi:hypothetical protein
MSVTAVQALADLVILERGLDVGGSRSMNRAEEHDFLRVVELTTLVVFVGERGMRCETRARSDTTEVRPGKYEAHSAPYWRSAVELLRRPVPLR